MSDKFTFANSMKAVFVQGVALAFVALTFIYALFPAARGFIVREGGLLEYLSASLWLAGFVFGVTAWRLRRLTGARWYELSVPLLGLLAFLDETSCIGLLAGKDNPGASGASAANSPLVLFGKYPIDGFHDFFTLPFKLALNSGLSKETIAGIAIVCVALPLVLLRKKYMPFVMGVCRRVESMNYLRYAFVLVLVAQIMDLEIMPEVAGTYIEELFEMLGGLCIAFASVSMLMSLRKNEY